MAKQKRATVSIQIVKDVEIYKVFIGPDCKLMQILLANEEDKGQLPRLPISPKQLMELRLGVVGEEDDKEDSMGHFVDTNTVRLPNPKGEDIKFVHEYPLIYALTPETQLVNGYLPITSEEYKKAKGFHLTSRQANAFRRNPHALPEARREFINF